MISANRSRGPSMQILMLHDKRLTTIVGTYDVKLHHGACYPRGRSASFLLVDRQDPSFHIKYTET